MSIKSTIWLRRACAVEVLVQEIHNLPNGTLGKMLDIVAESKHSRFASPLDNFIVSEFEPQPQRANAENSLTETIPEKRARIYLPNTPAGGRVEVVSCK